MNLCKRFTEDDVLLQEFNRKLDLRLLLLVFPIYLKLTRIGVGNLIGGTLALANLSYKSNSASE